MRTQLYKLLCALFCTLPLTAAAQDQTVTPLSVGAILPLTGPLAEYGVAFKNGVELAQSDHPELFKHLAIRYEDSRYEAGAAVSAFKKLHESDKVRLAFVWGNPTSEAVAPLAERVRMPTIALVMNPAVSIGKKYIIRASNHAAMFSEVLASYLRTQRCETIGVVLAENSYLNGVFDGLRDKLGSGHTVKVIDNYQPGDNDFRASVSKIKSSNYNCVGVFLMSGQISQFYRQSAQQRVKVPTFGTDFFESSTEIASAQGTMDGAVYVHLGVAEEFRNKYIARYKNDLQVTYAGNGYDMATLIAETARALGPDAATDQIMAALRKDEQRAGVEGPYRYTETPEGGAYYEFPIYIKQIKGDSFIVLNSDKQ